MTIPPRGSMQRAWAEWAVQWRRIGRALIIEIRGWRLYRWYVALLERLSE